MNNVSQGLFGGQSKWKVFDAREYWEKEYMETNTFGISIWEMNHKDVYSNCKVVNFACMNDMDPHSRSQMAHIVETCISWDILPDIDEVMQLNEIPRSWIEDHVYRLGDLNQRFTQSKLGLQNVLIHIDEHLQEGPNPIPLALISSDTLTNDGIFGEKELYVQLRESLAGRKLKNFSIGHVLYLSEIVTDDTKDPMEIVKMILELGEVEGRVYSRLIYDVKNLLKTDTNPDRVAELVKIANRHGILVDTSTESQDYEVKLYRKLYGRVYDFSTTSKILESLKKAVEMYGDDFFIADDFRKWYPVTLTFEDGNIILTTRGGWDNAGNFDEINVDSDRFLIKLKEGTYRLNIANMRGSNDRYALVSEAYVYDDSTLGSHRKLKFY